MGFKVFNAIQNCPRRCLTTVSALMLTVLGGCATQTQQIVQPEATPQQENATTTDTEVSATPSRPIPTDTLYALLVAEMAINRKRYDIALSNYVQQAIQTRDSNVASRATHIARGLNARQSALEMSRLWLELAPENSDARIITSVELIENNQLLEAFELSKSLLATNQPTVFKNIADKAEKGDIQVVHTLSEGYEALLEEYKDDIGLWLGHSVLLQKTGNLEQALSAAESAVKLDTDSIHAVLQEARVLHKMGNAEKANKRLAELVENNPNNIGLRARYARLIWSTSPELARKQFQILHEQSPGDAEILYSLALVEKDLGHLNDAKGRFELLLSRKQHTSAAHYHLGDIYQSLHDVDTALEHFTQVGLGQSYISAVAKASDILVNRNESAKALALVKERQTIAIGKTQENLFLLESNIYIQSGQMSAAEKALSRGIESFQDSERLLYSRAMLYTQIDYITAAEKDLKRVLELVPEHAAALNALGYTLADRTDRYQEAYEYIKQAYALTPEDPAVIDSMGWVAFRLGNHNEALLWLRKAMAALPDHEIAAHLGEVLWVLGNHEEAIKIWQQGLELKPKSKIIHRTMHRLEAKAISSDTN